ncbi:MAG: siphovirus ReqiPepy6 Gp37-like family protein [Clostridiales bacterium]|nr:siphovirus ReqiPepy6 Gp37-like family protein [Clostridiales bacterium]
MDINLYRYDNGSLIDAGIVDDFITFQYPNTYSSVGEWELTIALTSPNAERLMNADIISFGSKKSGLILSRDWEYDDNQCVLTVSGLELKGIAALRIVLPPTGQAQLTGDKLSPEDYIKQLIQTQITDPQDGSRMVVGTISAPPSVPGDLKLEARFDDLGPMIEDAATTAQVGWRAYVEDGAIKWEIYSGTDRGTGGSGSAVWSHDRDSFNRLEVYYALRAPGWTLVAGKGKDTNRVTATVGSGTALNRWEIYTDARDKAAPELPAEGQSALAEFGDVLDVRAVVAQHLVHSMGDYWDLGDIVTVQDIVAGQDLDLRVTEIIDTFEGNVHSLEVVLGYARKTLKDSLRRARRPVTALLRIETD